HEEDLRAGLEAALVRPLAEAVEEIGARAAGRGQRVPAARLALLGSVLEAFWWQRYTSDRGAMSHDEVLRVLDDVLLPLVAPDEVRAPV
ncbi:MAG: TetR/AcrR family transcriptional regulator C-terminal ligand-binding domain-containing protein, partial [Actinomycetota bacterium]|nr:TetR/AcrR family transcriptional regulator C-terminal ligand-binding domain-containing protein [Actinomycetota bacterium]